MTKIYKLFNQIKHYEWGSPSLIPDFLGLENKENLPFAEMWMGTNKAAPSYITSSEMPKISLEEANGATLPFLFKLLAANKPLSIQAHPDKEQAAKGFERENKAGIALDDPKRNYKDANHKPEILCALTPFTVMCGFRESAQIKENLEIFLHDAPELKEYFLPLIDALDADSLADFLWLLFETEKNVRRKISIKLSKYESANEAFKYMRTFANLYPNDAAVLSPLYLNLFTLNPGEAIFVPAGTLHAYISGLGVELMADSDNVLRGGLTPKHIDIQELMNILEFKSFMPQIICPPFLQRSFRHLQRSFQQDAGSFCYPAQCDDFSLFFYKSEGEQMSYNGKKTAVCLVTEGNVEINEVIFKKGESFFIPRDSGNIFMRGNFSLFAAL